MIKGILAKWAETHKTCPPNNERSMSAQDGEKHHANAHQFSATVIQYMVSNGIEK
jgi:hypothetical protein